MRPFLKLPRPFRKFSLRNKDTIYKPLLVLFAIVVISIYKIQSNYFATYYDEYDGRETSLKDTLNPNNNLSNVWERKIIPMEDRKDENEIVYASFGTSNTWGAKLPNRDVHPYVKRLSSGDPARGKNFGMRSTGPNYPAACAHSIIGNDEFDVIILEYFMRAGEGLRSFSFRLRERFPNALIIFVRMWGPYQFRHIRTNMNLSDWAKSQGFGHNYIHDARFASALLDYGEENFLNNYWNPEHPIVKYQESVADEIGAYIVKMHAGPKAFGPGGWLGFASIYLAEDSFHLSIGGHGIIAEQIRDIIREVGVPKDRQLGQFRGLDVCQNWFETGEINGDGLTYSPNGKLDKMPNTDKYVLSFESDDENNDLGSGWIGVKNESDEVMDIFVSYMTTGPPPSKYPRVEVTRHYDDDNGDTSQYILEPESIGWGDKEVHVVRLAHIGQIQPGSSNNNKIEKIYFKPLEQTKYPFRLTAVAITPVNTNENEKLSMLEYSGTLST
jgi:hypothetical protein